MARLSPIIHQKLTERVIQIVIVVYGVNVVDIMQLDAIYVVQLQLFDVADQGGPFSLVCLLMRLQSLEDLVLHLQTIVIHHVDLQVEL
jgi:hypothetical protein